MSEPLKYSTPAPSSLYSSALVHTHYGWLAPWFMPLAQQNRELALHVLEQPPHHLHYLAILSLVEPNAHELPAFAQALKELPKRTILNRYPVTRGTACLLKKMPNALQPQVFYQMLLEALRNGRLNVLKLLSEIRIHHLIALGVLPEELTQPDLLRHIADMDDLQELEKYWAEGQIHRKDLSPKDLYQSLRQTFKMKDDSSLSPFPALFKPIKFPPHPWLGNERIVPIRSRKALNDVALRFRNCLMEINFDALTGGIFLYTYHGRVPAVISVKREGERFRLSEVKGVKNDTLPLSELIEIKNFFSQHGITGLEPIIDFLYDSTEDFA